jgi:hypothetical protein
MTLLAAIVALFEMSGSKLDWNPWTKAFLDLTLANLHGIQNFFGWVALVAFVILVGVAILALVTGKNLGAAFSATGCLGIVCACALLIWLVGWLHILVVGYLANNFSAATGALNPGFWVLLFFMVVFSWS